MKLRENNLFRYATGELSQDAFICWLLSHLTDECYDFDKNITACANEFMAEVFKNTDVWKDGKRVNSIKTQYKKIDVLVEVDDYRVIIEDKTFTSTHDDQINRYKQALVYEKIDEEKIISVFYKIIEQADKENVDCEFDRKKLLGLFKKYSDVGTDDFINNQIFIDYVEYLECIDYEVNLYKDPKHKINNWSNRTFMGFFEHLRATVLKDDGTGWDYIANPRGGCMALWVYDVLNDDDLINKGFDKNCIKDLYLQLEKREEKNKVNINEVTKEVTVISVKYSLDNAKELEKTYKDTVLGYKWKIIEYFNDCLGGEFTKSINKYAESMTVGYIKYDETNYEEKIKLMKDTLKNIVIK